MSSVLTFLLSPFLSWLPSIFFGVILFLTFLSYFSPHKPTSKYHLSHVSCFMFHKITYKKLIAATLLFRFFYPAFLTAGQWYVWSKHEFTTILLSLPLDPSTPIPLIPASWLSSLPSSYFLFYVFGRFWGETLLTLLGTLLVYLFLKGLERYNKRFLEEQEIHIGVLSTLIVGWPGMVILLLLSLLFFLGWSLFRLLYFNERLTKIANPFLFATLITFLGGDVLVNLLQLQVLII